MQEFEVKQYPWGKEYCPRTTAWLEFQEGKGFEICMRCEEESVRAEYTQNDSPVYEDSCMECFLQFFPEKTSMYLNFEVNANGALLCQMGTGKNDRVYLREKGISVPKIDVKKEKEFWEIRYLISLELLKAVYGEADFVQGQKIRGNFYKCGDKTEVPHYGCWSFISNENPNFHLPEYFGEIVL